MERRHPNNHGKRLAVNILIQLKALSDPNAKCESLNDIMNLFNTTLNDAHELALLVNGGDLPESGGEDKSNDLCQQFEEYVHHKLA